LASPGSFLLPLTAAILALLGVAAPSGMLASNAAELLRPLARPRDDESDGEEPLLLIAPRDEGLGLGNLGHKSHSSHRSHSSHASHASHYSGAGASPGPGPYVPSPTPQPAPQPTYTPPPEPPKPAVVSFIAYPGGRILVDGQVMGRDSTGNLTLKPGKHEVTIENRFLGNTTMTVELTAGQTGVVQLEW